jgi:hypothetical protein
VGVVQLALKQGRGWSGVRDKEGETTYVPGFWSAKGWMETVWTDMMRGLEREVKRREEKRKEFVVSSTEGDEGLASCVDHPTFCILGGTPN